MEETVLEVGVTLRG